MINSKRKGSKFELKFAKILRSSGLDKKARRSFMSGATWSWKSDIYSKLNYAFELKKQEIIHLWKWWEQAESQRKPYKPPVLVISSNNRPILCTMKLEDWINLIKENEELQAKFTEKEEAK